MYVFQVNQGYTDHSSAESAIAAVEAIGSGSVVKFMLVPNRPGCLPAHVHQSCGMWSFEDGKWSKHNIYDGYGNACGEGRPC